MGSLSHGFHESHCWIGSGGCEKIALGKVDLLDPAQIRGIEVSQEVYCG